MLLNQFCFFQNDIYMFGGKLEMGASNVTDELWVFNIPKMTWSQKSPSVPAHGQIYAVEGHSSHIVELDNGDVVMVVIFGYSSIYSYISNVQEYNISEWLSSVFDWDLKVLQVPQKYDCRMCNLSIIYLECINILKVFFLYV